MSYVDGFIIPIPTRNLATYKRMAALGAKLWMEHGALGYYECVGDDLDPQGPMRVRLFTALAKAKRGETVLFSFIIFRSRAHRDRVNKRVMSDPRLTAGMATKAMPFDVKRMAYGGFKALVQR